MTPDQIEALDILKNSKRNIFLTGQPGTGKTYTINSYVDWCIENGTIPTITASTGIAAVHVQGRTLHSWAGLRNDNALTEDDIDGIVHDYFAPKNYFTTDILIIDEISMVSAQLLENIDILARIIRRSDKPFGGIRIIAVGDFFQLPPIGANARFAFESDVWGQADFVVCYLKEQHRQQDKVFNDILTGVRAGILTEEQKECLRARVCDDVSGKSTIRLDTHNNAVDKINAMKLDRIQGTPKVYRMTSKGNEKLVNKLKDGCLSPETLLLKVGAQVMFTKNDSKEKQWVNGSQGIVTAVSGSSVTVQKKDGTIVEVTESTWEHTTGYGKYKKTLASITQLPLRLAYAITIHKSQGMTLDSAVIDVTRVFECGQAYVALSRVRSLDCVFFQGKLTSNFLKVSPIVAAKDKEFLAYEYQPE